MALWISCEPFTVASWTTSVLRTTVWEALNQTAHIVHPNKTLLCLQAEAVLQLHHVLK